MGRKFTCERCGYTAESEWSEENAMAEYEQKFGKHMGEEIVILCDNCQKQFDIWFAKQDKKGITN